MPRKNTDDSGNDGGGDGGDDGGAGERRSENTELYHAREVGRREQQDLSRENEKLVKKLEALAKYDSLTA